MPPHPTATSSLQYHLPSISYWHFGQPSPPAESPEMGSLTLTSLLEIPATSGILPDTHKTPKVFIFSINSTSRVQVLSSGNGQSRQNVTFHVWMSTAMWCVLNYNWSILQYHIRKHLLFLTVWRQYSIIKNIVLTCIVYSTGNYTQYLVISYNGRNYKKKNIYIYTHTHTYIYNWITLLYNWN